MRKKITMLLASLFVCMGVMKAQVSLYVSETLPGTLEGGQYSWLSDVLTAPEGGLKKLRVTFLENTNEQDFHGYPCVALAEFNLYDKNGDKVSLTADMFSSNATETQEGSIGELCDGNTTQQEGEGQYDWYWHSFWSAAPSPKGHHYLELDLSSLTEVDLSEYKIGWVTRSEDGSPAEVIISTGETSEDVYLSSLFAKNGENPVYYAIRNVRNGNYYATYAKNNGNVLLNTAISPASLFYFTGAVENGVATVKIQNKEAAALKMEGFTSWNADGIDWYIQKSGNTEAPGYAISKNADLAADTKNEHSWNNTGNTNTTISAYGGNDVGSTFELIPLSTADIEGLDYISGPEDLVSGNTYNFRNLSALKFLTGGDKLNTHGNRNDDTRFAYYVSPYIGAKYLYNISAAKFIGTTSTANADIPLSENPVSTELIFKKTNFASFPVMFSTDNGSGAVNYSGWYGKVLNWESGFNDVNSKDNSFCVEKVSVVDETTLATIGKLVGNFELTAKITEAQAALSERDYLVDEDKEAFNAAIVTAQAVLDNTESTAEELNTQIALLDQAIASATIVSEVDGFKNAYVYTFVSKRGWMGADDTDGVISGTGTADNTNYQWAVYKSEKGYSYLYNIGKGQFMGVETRNNTQMPFSKTPQTTGLVFKKSDWADYPIMFSMDNQTVVNNNKNNAMICWTEGWNKLNDEGSNHKVTIVDVLDNEVLTAIAAAVELYETQGVAVQDLEAAIAAAQTRVNDMGEGLGYYSTTNANAVTDLEAIKTFRETITSTTTVDDINEQAAAAEAITASYTLNVPVAGKFYRFSHMVGETQYYVQAIASGASGKAKAMAMTTDNGAASIFHLATVGEETKILSYTAGLYVHEEGNTRGLQNVGVTGGNVSFYAREGRTAPTIGIRAPHSFHFNSTTIDGQTVYFVDHCDNNVHEAHDFIVEEVTTLPVAVSAAGYATLYAPVALEIPEVEGLKVYTATVGDTYVRLTEIEGGVIPAETGVIIEAPAETYDFVITEETADVTSDFVGSFAKSVKNADAKVYTLQNGANGVGFYLFKGQNSEGATTYINGFRAWVELDLASQVQSLRITRGEEGDNTTGIESVATDEELVIYDLAGRRVQKMEKGIYIVNGKKVIK